jgi:hypothetical protein
VAALTTIAAIAAIASSAVSIGSTLTQKPPKGPSSPAAPPAPPDPNIAATATEAALSRRKGKAAVPGAALSGRASTLLTGASGLVDKAPTERKTLLGQ